MSTRVACDDVVVDGDVKVGKGLAEGRDESPEGLEVHIWIGRQVIDSVGGKDIAQEVQIACVPDLSKLMKNTPQIPVVLTLVSDDDLAALANGDDFIDIRRRRHARLLNEAHEQGGALAHTDLSALTLTTERVVGRDIDHVQEQDDCLLPTRGVVHDLSPTSSHKVEVMRLFEAGHLEPEITRKLSPVHSLRSIECYIQKDKNLLKLSQQGFSLDDNAGILDIGRRLVAAYIELVNEHDPTALAANPHLHW